MQEIDPLTVSIHAPARGATQDGRPRRHGRKRFDPRPCERGDPATRRPLQWPSSFDPRPCERGDRCPAAGASALCCFDPRPCERGDASSMKSGVEATVSIHAPARGATKVNVGYAHMKSFRSTPLREGRPLAVAASNMWLGFDPRPCERGDKTPARSCRLLDVSIHAPARGATLKAAMTKRAEMFRSTPLREGRPSR